jgi:hypothetical protein
MPARRKADVQAPNEMVIIAPKKKGRGGGGKPMNIDFMQPDARQQQQHQTFDRPPPRF